MKIDIERARKWTQALAQALATIARDNPDVAKGQVWGWVMTDLSYLGRDLGMSFAGKHPEPEHLQDVLQLHEGGEEVKDDEYPCDEAFSLAQILSGAVMPSAMFYTSWPDEYFDMMKLASLLQRSKVKPQVYARMIKGIYTELDKELAPDTFEDYDESVRPPLLKLQDILLSNGVELENIKITPSMSGNCLVDWSGIPMWASVEFYEPITEELKTKLETFGLLGDTKWMFLPLPSDHKDFEFAMKYIQPRCDVWKAVDADPNLPVLEKNQWKWKHYRECEEKRP